MGPAECTIAALCRTQSDARRSVCVRCPPRIDDDVADGRTRAAETYCGLPRRYQGIIVLVSIYYDNTVSYDPTYVVYKYNVRLFQGADNYAVESIYSTDLLTRTLRYRTGVRFIFLQYGTVLECRAASNAGADC
jgi:hypothetical protein